MNNRNGTTTTLTDKVYENVWPWAKTPGQRLEIYAKTLGILTEYWRAHRKAAAVMHFCGLGYSRPEDPSSQTSDHFIDLENLTYEPNFYKYVRPAFSPVGIMADFWEKSVTKGEEFTLPVHIINDTYSDFSDTLKVSVFRGDSRTYSATLPVKADACRKVVCTIPVALPDVTGKCRLEAEIMYKEEQIKSIREFEIR